MPPVLIVDDNPATLEMLAEFLGVEGFQAETALSGVSALLLARSGRFDVILMDIMMPGLNGVETLRTIKSLTPDTPVIMMTAYKGHELAEQARERGATAVLWKPFGLDELLATIHQATGTGQKPTGEASAEV